jgi:hypothetical protein
MVRSNAEEEKRSSCDKGHSNKAADANVDSTDAGAWGYPP